MDMQTMLKGLEEGLPAITYYLLNLIAPFRKEM